MVVLTSSMHLYAQSKHTTPVVQEQKGAGWLYKAQVSNSSPGGPLCRLVFWLFSAPLVHSSHLLAKEWTHLGLQALIDSWLKGNHKNLQTLGPLGIQFDTPGIKGRQLCCVRIWTVPSWMPGGVDAPVVKGATAGSSRFFPRNTGFSLTRWSVCILVALCSVLCIFY